MTETEASKEEIAAVTELEKQKQWIKITFNKPPFFPDTFLSSMKIAADAYKFSGDGLITKKCTDFFREKYGYQHSLLTPSCTAALEMAALILDVGPGDEVIVPSFTFVTTANAFALRGVKLVFADSEKGYPNVSVDDILKKVTDKTKAIVVVHYAGKAVDVKSIIEKTGNKIPVVEDCAHAIEAMDAQKKDFIGKAGCLSTFSFHETKNLGIGEGGLLVVNDEKLWRTAQIIREKGTNRTDFHAGKVAFYTWVSLGSSYLMSEVDAAALWSALQNVDTIQKRRLEIWDHYDKKIKPSSFFRRAKFLSRANAHMYYLEFYSNESLKDFCAYMKNKNILVATHYVPLDVSPYILEAQGQPTEPCKNSAKWSRAIVRLPLFYDLTPEMVDTVIDAVNEYSHANGLRYVAAEEKYWEAIRVIRNDNAKGFKNNADISKEDHWKFMGKHAKDYHVAVTPKGQCLGFVGLANNDFRLAVIDKGKGVAGFLVSSMEFMVGDHWNYAVLRKNKVCLGFCRKFGYEPDPKAWAEGQDPVPMVRTIPRELWEF